MRDGESVRVGATTTTSATGSFSIALGGGLAAGSTYFVTTDSYLHDELAVCGAAQSAKSQVPVPVEVDPPGGSVPGPSHDAPVLTGVKLTKQVIHVVGSSAKPRVTKLKLRLNVAATVVVSIKGGTNLTGNPRSKKVKATVSTTLGAGASVIKLTGRLGTKRLPPGTYRVTIRASNAIGAATASAGRLKVKP